MADTRASGRTPGEDESRKASQEFENPPVEAEEEPINLTRAFRRMRTDWNAPDRAFLDQIHAMVDSQILDDFGQAYRIQFDIYNIVCDPVVDPKTGEVQHDEFGLPIWQTTPDGKRIEHWERISRADADKIQYAIITKMFDWKQKQADLWGDALFAKARWEEAYATAFDTAKVAGKDTDAVRNAIANRTAADHRYFAVFRSMYSKKADAVVYSIELLSQRLKDLTLG